MADAYKNFAVSAVGTAPSPATSGTSLVVTTGHGARFPAVPFNASIWPSGVLPDPSNAEIVRVTAIATDTLTITRAQEGTTARTVVVGDLIAATITKKLLDELVPATPGAHHASHETGGSDAITALSGSVITTGTVASARLPARIAAVGIVIDGGGSVITTGVKGFVEVPFACTITAVTLLSTDASATAGSIVIDVWKDAYANYPPVVGDSITASAKPTLSSANKSRDTTLTGWTTAISAGDVLGFSVTSATTVTKVALSLTVQAT